MTVEDLIDELKQHPPTARVEVWFPSLALPVEIVNDTEECRTPISVEYDKGVVVVHLECDGCP